MRIVFLPGPFTTCVTSNDIRKSLQGILSHYASLKERPSHKNISSSFLLFDKDKVKSVVQAWNQHLPKIKPHYALKCNPSPPLLKELDKFSESGLSVDCASHNEMYHVLQHIPEIDMNKQTILSNPRKLSIDLETADRLGVRLTVADTEDEIIKIVYSLPQANLLWRLNIPNSLSESCSMSRKFGASIPETKMVLSEWFSPSTKSPLPHGIRLKGFHFHMGSANRMEQSLPIAKKHLSECINFCLKENIFASGEPIIINMGGGFINKYFIQDVKSIQSFCDDFSKQWPSSSFVFMAEPGRLFAEQSFWLVSNVIAVRYNGEIVEYTLNESVYHTMSGIRHDGWKLSPFFQEAYQVDNHGHIESLNSVKTYKSSLFGVTCDGSDIIMSNCILPKLSVGDTLVWNNMGAYSTSSSTPFNGINSATAIVEI